MTKKLNNFLITTSSKHNCLYFSPAFWFLFSIPRRLSSGVLISSFQFSLTGNTCAVRFSYSLLKRNRWKQLPTLFQLLEIVQMCASPLPFPPFSLSLMPMLFPCNLSSSVSYLFAPLTTWLLSTVSSLCWYLSHSPHSSYGFVLCVNIVHTIHSFSPDLHSHVTHPTAGRRRFLG